MKSNKRKKLDILYRQLRRLTDDNSTSELIKRIHIENKIRKLNGKKEIVKLPKEAREMIK